ncbi:hypothetical protein ACFVTF_26415 [Kitasatospora sp. NPDC057940]|uniref:hypothetical protein n=1 Tax=Kitasatospora sp. NPDC057940 TaxID=3346285 RepID=UPI0036DA5AF0
MKHILCGPQGEEIGTGYYHFGWTATRTDRVLRHTYPDGTERLVWADVDGRALITGWFKPGWHTTL